MVAAGPEGPGGYCRAEGVRTNQATAAAAGASSAPAAATPAPPSRKPVTVKPMTSAHLIHLLSAHVAWPLTGWGWCIGPTRRTIPFGENEGSGESVRVRKHWHDFSYWRWLWHGR